MISRVMAGPEPISTAALADDLRIFYIQINEKLSSL